MFEQTIHASGTMHIHADTTSDTNSHAMITSGPSVRTDDSEGVFRFDDQRPEAVAQRKLVDLMQSGPRVMQLQGEGESPANPEIVPEETENEQETEELSEEESMQADDGDDDDLPEEQMERLMTSYNEEISLFDETHHLERRLVNGEYELGVASRWTDLSTIHVRLRLLGTSVAWRNLWRALDRHHKEVKRLTVLSDAAHFRFRVLGNQLKALRGRDAIKYAKVRKDSDKAFKRQAELQDKLSEEMRLENRTATRFIRQSAEEFGTETAEILGAKMPKISYDSDVAIGDANTVRYHTGDTNADPIPITWYKPANSYQNIQVTDHQTNALVTLQPFPGGANPVVQDSGGTNYQFGVAVPNRIGVGTVLRNMPKHGKSRTRQQELNDVLADLNYNMAGEDGDHVKDLGFGGNDVIGNYWPLDSTTNRHAFTGWRSTYYLNFKTGTTLANGEEQVRKAALNSGELIGKYVRVVGEEDRASPTNNNTSASGSSTAWGPSEMIADSAGNAIQEG